MDLPDLPVYEVNPVEDVIVPGMLLASGARFWCRAYRLHDLYSHASELPDLNFASMRLKLECPFPKC